MTDYEMPADTRDDYPDDPPRCRCSHGPSLHTRGRGECWSTACGCQSYRPKEDQ